MERNYFLGDDWHEYIRGRFAWHGDYLAQVDLVDADDNIVWGLAKKIPLPAMSNSYTSAEFRPWFIGFDAPKIEHTIVYTFNLTPYEARRIASARLEVGHSDMDRE
jgi:hypothetical protein